MGTLNFRCLCGVTAVASISLINHVHATENGAPSTPIGLYDFGTGFMPPTTDLGTFASRLAFYSSDTLHNNNGNPTAGQDFNLDVTSLSAVYLRMTNTTLFGGRYGFSAVFPMLKMDGGLSVSIPDVGVVFQNETQVFRDGDIQAIPLILQWSPQPNLAVNTQFAVQAPTGDYDADSFVSPGLNHWVFSPSVGFTYINNSGYEVSSHFQLDISTKNDATDYKNGIEYRHDFGIGKHIQNWTVGLGGYYYRQLTDDKTYSNYSGPSITDGNRGEVLALGPALSYFSPGKPAVLLHAYKEFAAVNRSEGINIALRIAQTF